MEEDRKIREQLAAMQLQHRELDDKISSAVTINMLEMQRWKKQKLMLKDAISKLTSELLPDITA